MALIERKFNNRTDWLQWRHEGVGASDVAKIYNASRYGDYNTLLHDKLQPKPADIDLWGPIQVACQVTEQEARNRLSEHLGHPMEPVNFEDSKYPEARVSLDGWHEGTKTLLEHKMMGKARREATEAQLAKSEVFLDAIEGDSPLKEIALQMAYQAYLTGPEYIYLIITDYKTRNMKVYRNENTLQWGIVGLRALDDVLKFWKVVQCKRQPSTSK